MDKSLEFRKKEEEWTKTNEKLSEKLKTTENDYKVDNIHSFII